MFGFPSEYVSSPNNKNTRFLLFLDFGCPICPFSLSLRRLLLLGSEIYVSLRRNRGTGFIKSCRKGSGRLEIGGGRVLGPF